MDLSQVFSPIAKKLGQKEEKAERFLAAKISSQSVFATIWWIENGHVKIGQVASQEINEESYEASLSAIDKAVSAASVDFPEVSKAIFALPLELVSDGKIETSELSKLRKICKDLDLFPLGYVVVAEALEQYFKETEGAPLSAILVGLDGKKVAVSLYKAGREVGNRVLEKEGLAATVERGLKQFDHREELPSRIILYDGNSDLDSLANEIMAYPWTGKLPFLHFPKVEKVPAEFVVTAIAATGGVEMGGRLAPLPAPEANTAPSAEFVEVTAEEAGFATEMPSEPAKPMILEGIMEKVKTVPFKLPTLPTLPNFKPKEGKGVPKIALIVVGIILVMVIGLFASWYFIPKALVIVKVNSIEFNKEVTVAIGDGLSGQPVEASEIGTKRSVATGQKLVGKAASGNVTIYSDSEGKTFPADTVLTSPTGLKFTLEKEVTVASGDAVSSATVTVPVKASVIGESFNLGSGTKFSVGNFSSSDYLAKNDSAFTGGESHMATVVTKADQDRLMASLSAELSEKALADLQSKVGADQKLLPNAVISTISKSKFSKDIDAEADTVSLDLTMDFNGVVFSKDEAINLFEEKFKEGIPEGYKLIRDGASLTVVSAKTDKNKNTQLTLRLNSVLLPKVDASKIGAQISGKSQSAAAKLISATSGVTTVQFEASPAVFSGLLKLALPFKPENIKVEVIKN